MTNRDAGQFSSFKDSTVTKSNKQHFDANMSYDMKYILENENDDETIRKNTNESK